MPSYETCKVLMFANTDWYLYNFRLPLAKEIQAQGGEVVLVSPPGEYAERLQEAGFRWIPLKMDRGSINPFSQIKSVISLVRIYREVNPDLVHHFTLKCVLYGSLAARLAQIPSRVNAVAGMGFIFSSQSWKALALRPLIKGLLRFLLKGQSTRLILQNSEDRNHFINDRLVSKNYVRLIRGSGVNTQRFKPTQRDANIKPVQVLLATRLLWDKGVGEYVEAARLLRKSGLNAEFLLAGTSDTGSPASIPEEQIQQWHAEGVVRVLGHVERMEELLSRVDMVVLPTRYGEGVPRILLEAAASGLPIIATDTAGCREIVEHEVNGILVEEKDTYQLSVAISHLVINPLQRACMGMEGRAKAVKEFDERLVINRTLSIYKEVIPSVRKSLVTAT